MASKIVEVCPSRTVLYGEHVRVERHWWNGNRSPGGRRDVFIRTDGQKWEVEAQSGGTAGRSRVQQCPGPTSAGILASAWRGGRPGWRELAPQAARGGDAGGGGDCRPAAIAVPNALV